MKTALRRERVQYILKHGDRYVGKGVVVCALKSDEVCVGSGGFAILISKKAVRTAVLRNRIRRVLREVVRSFDCGCVDFVVLCRSGCDSEDGVREQLHMLLCNIFAV